MAELSTTLEALRHIQGFLFVVFILSILSLVLTITGSVFKFKDKKSKPVVKTTPAAAPVVPRAQVADGMDDETVVLISTTVAMLLGQKKHRVVSIQPNALDWGREGRRQHIISRKVR